MIHHHNLIADHIARVVAQTTDVTYIAWRVPVGFVHGMLDGMNA
jgi:hypothetical protein